MKCPRCVRAIAPGEAACRECGFSLDDQDEQFGSDSVYLERVTDPAGCFRAAEAAAIESALIAFEQAFPQLFLAIYSGSLPPMTSLRQFGFWLLNRAAISSLESSRPNENGAVLVLDAESGSAALVVGYFVEQFVKEADLLAALQVGREHWSKDRLAAGTLAVVQAYTKCLAKKAARKASYQRPAEVADKPAEVASLPEEDLDAAQSMEAPR